MKPITSATVFLLSVALAACTPPQPQPGTTQPAIEPTSRIVSEAGKEADVRNLVENFGQRLKLVSLLAPSAAQDLQKHYSEFVSPTLLETWMKDISKAPGRMVSSPWPDRIEINTLVKETPNRYVIQGFVAEITSTEIGTDKTANKIPIRIAVERNQGDWLITEYVEEH